MKAIVDFVEMSNYIHDLYVQLYDNINDNYRHSNLKGLVLV